jgi:hypothetical protein
MLYIQIMLDLATRRTYPLHWSASPTFNVGRCCDIQRLPLDASVLQDLPGAQFGTQPWPVVSILSQMVFRGYAPRKNNGIQPNTSSCHPSRINPIFGIFNLESSLLQEMLDLGDMVALDHNVPSRSVDHDLLLSKLQELPQLIPQHLRLSVDLLHPSHGLVSSGLFQSVDGQVPAGRPGDKVWQIGRAKVRL